MTINEVVSGVVPYEKGRVKDKTMKLLFFLWAVIEADQTLWSDSEGN